jgi:hypothetical protein
VRVRRRDHGPRRQQRQQAHGRSSPPSPTPPLPPLTPPSPTQVIFPHEANLKKLASDLSVSGDLTALSQSDKIRDAVLKSLNATGKKAGFKPLEQLQTVVITDEEWTPQNGLLTAAQKLNRKEILKKYKGEVDVSSPVSHSQALRRVTDDAPSLAGQLPVNAILSTLSLSRSPTVLYLSPLPFYYIITPLPSLVYVSPSHSLSFLLVSFPLYCFV